MTLAGPPCPTHYREEGDETYLFSNLLLTLLTKSKTFFSLEKEVVRGEPTCSHQSHSFKPFSVPLSEERSDLTDGLHM